MMDKQTILSRINAEDVKMHKLTFLMTIALGILIVIAGLQAFQLRTVSQAIKNGSVVASPQAQQGVDSLLGNLRGQVGGCGG